MRKLIFLAVSVAALTAIAVFALGVGTANAGTVSTASDCKPVLAHTEYKWVPDVTNAGPTQWTTDNAPANTKRTFPWKGQLVSYHRDGNKSQFIDSVTCAVSAPVFNLNADTCSVTVPYTPGIDTFLYGVNGHPDTDAITQDVTVTGSLDGATDTAPQFWIGYTAKPGYVISNPGAAPTHFDFYNGDYVLDCATQNITMDATSDAVIDLPALNSQLTKMTITVNGDTRWGPEDGHEGDWGGYNPMTGTYTDAGFTNGRPVVFIGQTSVPHGQPNDWTVEPSSPGAVIYRINGGAWHQLTAQTTEFTLADGADIDLRYNDAIGGYVDDGSDRPSTVNSGHYDIVVTRSK